jgi:hypothetical protein
VKTEAGSAPNVFHIDLETVSGQLLAQRLAKNSRLVRCWFAIPCGAMSRDREKRVPDRLLKLGAPDPRPLRSVSEPMGVFMLSLDLASDDLSVRKGATQCRCVLDRGEPSTVHLAAHTTFLNIALLPNVLDIDTQMCMHGLQANKWT